MRFGGSDERSLGDLPFTDGVHPVSGAGESDFPKTYCFMRSGKDSLVGSPAEKISSRKCFEDMVFEPKVDGDVLAAAIMRIANRRHRAAEAEKLMKGGAR